ncbi:Scr1 family TA system antitoxin-like transcriptional regulator [Nocardiopsis sp. FIRDI 009]|uniref:helix-turn-helix domain-containing protein n=1 Tax=Nocardiopsis sp. FIRDI 009 TaxID=714197 RepID=UPI001E64C61F|nr:Scr1 family TA system antitoxin-like transcriptional regulator [Nocardiopsis sp. FIRDI 009]
MAGERRGVGGVGGEGAGESERSEWEVFGERVVRFRAEAGLTHDDLAMREVLSAGELREIERGVTAPARCTADYLDRRTGAKGRLTNAWARATINTHLAGGASPYELDTGAKTIREFSPGTIPVPLQTHDYCTALGRFTRDTGRRGGLWNRPGDLRVVVNETTVRTVVGGAEVMREQLRRLVNAIRGSGLRFQVIPHDVADHPCPMGPFRLLSLGPAYTVAHVVAPYGDGQLITAPSEIQAFSDLFEDLCGAALSVADSLALLTEAATNVEPTPSPKAIGSGNESSHVGGFTTLSTIAR